MLLREAAAGATVEVATVEVATVEVATVEVATVEAVTEVEGIFTVAAMAGDISAVGILVAVGATSAAVAVTSVAARLRGRVFAAIVLSPSITQTPYGH